MFDLSGKFILITGGDGLLGRAIVKALEECGANVVVTDSDTLDVRSPNHWRIFKNVPSYDGLVNCAGITNNTHDGDYCKDFFEYPFEDWRRVMDVNLLGTFLGCQIIGRGMVERRRGSIVNFGSLYGMGAPHFDIYPDTGIFQPPAYAASKAGVIGLTKYVAALFGPAGVRVNSITPGGVYNDHDDTFVERFTDLVPLHRMAIPEDVAAAVVFLMSDEAAYITGHNLVVDGGFSAW